MIKKKLTKINLETIKLWNKYKIDMSIRELDQENLLDMKRMTTTMVDLYI